MRTIEFFGQVGSGKSTVAQFVQRSLLEAGFEPINMKKAIDRCMERSWLGGLFSRFLPATPRRRLLKAIYSRGLYPLYSLRLALTNPRLFGAVPAEPSAAQGRGNDGGLFRECRSGGGPHLGPRDR